MITAVCFIALLLALGFKTWRLAVRATNAEAQATDLLRVNAEAAGDLLEVEGDLAEARAALAMTQDFHEYNTDVLRRVAAERDQLETSAQRLHWLPTVHGNLLDLVADLPDGFSLDFALPDNPPLFAEVLARTGADVVPIKKGGRK